MTDSAAMPQPGRIRPDWIVIGAVVVLCVGVFLYVMAGRQYALRDSPTGFEGLDHWLINQGHPTQSFTGGWPLDRTTIGLMIQPVYDTRPGQDRSVAQTKDELLLQADEFDQDLDVIVERANSVTSLIILPKWRSGMRLTGLGHPFLIVPRADVQTLLQDILGETAGRISYARTPFSDYELQSNPDLVAQLYAAQLFDGQGCDPLIGRAGAMLLGRCPLPSGTGQVYVLSDPDLLNNHGLVLGDNARIAAQLLPEIAGPKRIVIDYSDRNWLTEPQQVVERERTWSDLKRLFEPPFLVLWIGIGLILVLAIWRGGLRSGPVMDPQITLGAGKRTANRVRARLMRLTDQDGALLADFVDTRIRACAASVFGSAHVAAGSPETAYLSYVRTKKPDHAMRLETLIAEIRSVPPHLSPNDAIAYIDQFELILEQISHDA